MVGGWGGEGGLSLFAYYTCGRSSGFYVYSTATRLQVTHVHDTAGREPSVPHRLMFTVWGQRQ